MGTKTRTSAPVLLWLVLAGVGLLGTACPKPTPTPPPVAAAAQNDRDFNDPADPHGVCPEGNDDGAAREVDGCPGSDGGSSARPGLSTGQNKTKP